MAGPLNAYFDATLEVSRTVMDLCAGALRIDPGLFADAVTQPICNLNVNRYPPLREVGEVAEGQLRIAPHTDFGAVTILDREPGIGGLQVQLPNGRWVDAPYVEGALTVNIGDMLARWTGDRWRSTPHRVLPPDPSAPDEQLMSLVLFVDLDDEAMIAPIDGPRRGPNEYEPISAGAYLRAKLDAINSAA
ncbi:MAG: 2OG-Fe(II) oxygenase family protein [Actinomycetota bacterium]|nr:2OG-Fe(II) oxygenase family protein [Actinomycetota bacterium]